MQNMSDFYRPDKQVKGLNYAVFNLNDSTTRLYFRFPFQQLKYIQKTGLKPVAGYRLSYQVYDGYEKGLLVDSGSFQSVDSLYFADVKMDSISLKTLDGKNYIIQIILTDINTGISTGRYLNLPKVVHNQSADFLLTDLNNVPLVRNYIFRNEKVRLRTRFRQDSVLLLKQFGFNKPDVPVPPFFYTPDDEGYDQDNLQTTRVNFKSNVSDPFLLNDEGAYIFNSTGEAGFYIFRFYDGFPEIGSVIKMHESLRYISTDEEDMELMKMPPRAAVDKFWIGLTGNSERALSQIKRYYSRVEEANNFFTGSCEGWKSDRGMIYIVFGTPNIVYRNSVVEEWTYGDPGNPRSVRFYFHNTIVSNGLNDYILSRSEEYRRPWHLAVSNWRR